MTRVQYMLLIGVSIALGIIAALLIIDNARTSETSDVRAARVGSRFLYTFNVPGILEEADSPLRSRSPYWWLDSGGRLEIQNEIGKTISSTLTSADTWHEEYRRTNPVDTDTGAHPQNLFRLVSRSSWKNVRTEVSFFIAGDHFSQTANRNDSNGVLLMSRYADEGQTLYYAGLRVDGTAVIKKKYKGTYYTMAQRKIFPGTYSRTKKDGTSQNLLPHRTWMRLQAETETVGKNVSIRLSLKRSEDTTWDTLLSVEDTSQFDNTPPILASNPVGVRTDFMDVWLDDFLAEKI